VIWLLDPARRLPHDGRRSLVSKNSSALIKPGGLTLRKAEDR